MEANRLTEVNCVTLRYDVGPSYPERSSEDVPCRQSGQGTDEEVGVGVAFHDTDTDILAGINADTSDTCDFLIPVAS